MSLLDDLSQFLEARLEAFLREHPELELRALEEQLREQEADAKRSIGELHTQEQQLKADIWETAQDVQRWHIRIEKVEAAGEHQLAAAAREREAALLRKGNQLWGQMQGIKTRIEQLETLVSQLASKRQEVAARAAQADAQTQAQAKTRTSRSPWDSGDRATYSSGMGADPLEEQFQRWEMDEELEQLKRQMGRP
ncbi:MAG: TIGR04376 family protein [Limnothrix sp. BL-A-16]